MRKLLWGVVGACVLLVAVIALSMLVEACACLFDMIPWRISMWVFFIIPMVMLIGHIAEEIVYAYRAYKKNVH